jgi:predicted nucleic acid-binding protein
VIYVVANIVIRLIEGDAATRAPIEARLKPLRGTGCFLVTSQLTRLECRVKPLRSKDAALLALYDAFFTSVELALLDVTAAVLEKATEIRADLNLRTPDAIHLGSAILAGASAFLTGDRTLARCREVPVEIV